MCADVVAFPLARGGVMFPTAAGWIQYGAVPETIKDTMVLPDGVPAIFVVPQRLFHAERGVSLAELEFPCYYNFFLKGRRTTMVCRTAQRPILERVLAEAVFGPVQVDSAEFGAGGPSRLPDLAAEMTHFRKNPLRGGARLQLEDLVEFVEFDANGVARLPEAVTVAVLPDGGIRILEGGNRLVDWRGDPPLPRRGGDPPVSLRPFLPPSLGVSVIGSGHGFDPGNRTSGFIVWIEGHGVLVDPPVDSVDWLRGYDIPAKQVDSLILTHCHADHDAGTLQKILQEGRVTLYTTPTVHASFVTKYSALTGMTPEAFRTMFDYVPVRTEEPVRLHGAELTFRYSLHSIPCVGFDAKLRGSSLVYPSDTLNEPRMIGRLAESGVLSPARRDALLAFPWHHTLVLHEAGIPPIHTPIEYLSSLDAEIKSRTLLVHVSEKIVPAGSGLRVAPTGLENTIDLGAAHLPVQEAIEVLDALGRVEFFSDLPIARAAEFLRLVRKRTYAAGDVVVEQGAPGDAFYVILSGHAAIRQDGREMKVYSAFDFFGETALVLEQPRVADVVAKTQLEVLVLAKPDFLRLLRGTDIPQRLVRLAEVRAMPSWELLAGSPVFSALTSAQKTRLQVLMQPITLQPGEESEDAPFLVAEGRVDVRNAGTRVGTIESGGFAGDAGRIVRGVATPFRFQAETAVAGFRFDRAGLREFLFENPGACLLLDDLTAPWEAAARSEQTRAWRRGRDA